MQSVIYLTTIFMSLFLYTAAYAGQSDAVDIISTIQIEGLSLNSTADDIEAFINTKPSLDCQRGDTPERKSKIPSRPSTPRRQSWNCKYAHKTLSQVLNIQMSGGVITYLGYETGYEAADLFEETREYIKEINEKLEDAGLTSDQTNSNNSLTYQEQDIQGGSSPAFMQHLNAKKTALCDSVPIFFRASLNANKVPSQELYRVGMKAERSPSPIHCKNIE